MIYSIANKTFSHRGIKEINNIRDKNTKKRRDDRSDSSSE